MAEPKLYSEFRSDYGNFYLIEIWDENYTGTEPDKFNITGNGFELNYSGRTDNVYSPIIGSNVSLGIYVRDAASRAFVASLKDYQENRYYIKVWRGTFDGQNADQWYNTSKVSNNGLVMNFSPDEEQVVYLDFFWGGYIVQDTLQIEDASEPYVYKINASDGIAKLKNKDAGEAITPIQNIFSNAIFNAYTFNIFPTEWPALKIVNNWWSQQHTYNVNDDPLSTTALDISIFHNYDRNGSIRKTSYYEVLENVCKTFGMRFYFSNGSYRAEQIFERDNDNFKEFSYRRDGNLISSETVQRDKTLNQTSDKARLAGNVYNFLPAVNKTTIRTEEGDLGYSGILSSNVTNPIIDLGYTLETPENWMEVSFNYEIELEINTNVNTSAIYYVLDVDINSNDGTTVYYIKRTHNKITPNNADWVTTQSGSGYQVLVGPFYEEVPVDLGPPYSQFIRGSFTIVTPVIPQDGDIEIQFNSNKFININGGTRTLNAVNDIRWNTTTIQITKMNGNNGHYIEAESVNSKNDSGLIYDLGVSKIFDGNGNRGSLYKRNPSTLVNTLTTGWREGNTGAYITIQRLIANKFLSIMNKPIEKYQGNIFSSHDFMTRLVFDSKNWLQLGGRFTAREDTWDGEWFAISVETIAITNSDTGTIGSPVFSLGSSSLNGSSILGSVEIANLGAVDVTIGNDLGVAGDETIGGTLGVTGLSTLAATSVGAFTTTDQVNVTINQITATAAGSETLDNSKHFNFLSYSGGNGNYTITLPVAEDGVILRFKTDDSVVANKTITLQGSESEQIDGEDSYIMNRSYDGISIVALNSNWFIIQKKEK